MGKELIRSVSHLGFQWQTLDPFLFCVHHDDAYPKGNAQQGPEASLAGRRIGQDFEGQDGWRMYHGDVVPGFPRHPHRGFETVTVVRRGLVDHSDSLGATARYGGGDVQWMTAGKGIVHAEMFPLVQREADNPLELFQIWLNLPAERKLTTPAFKMLWADTIPTRTVADSKGGTTRITVYAGSLLDLTAPTPAPDSWAADPANEVGIWSIKLEPGALFTVPPARGPVNRVLYAFSGESLHVASTQVQPKVGVQVDGGLPAPILNGPAPAEVLVLQGRPIGENVAHYGPFVMNTRAELEQAFADYRSTGFGGWPWPQDDPVHEPVEGRFARHADGTLERPA
ncbi:MAG: pirin family protein [Myxococcales bacterium]|nr:pirin family protein [Myxococcales bacterium]